MGVFRFAVKQLLFFCKRPCFSRQDTGEQKKGSFLLSAIRSARRITMSNQWRAFSSEFIKGILAKSGGHCWYCGKPITFESRFGSMNGDTFVIDHYIAKHNGGQDDYDNLVPACCSCNNLKKARDIEDFRELITRLENGIPRFSAEQIYYLDTHGISLPEYPPHEFYFEKAGLQR